MTYRFTIDDTGLQAGLRRIALEQIDEGLAELNDDVLDRSVKVHQLRKRLKKLRGLIRLVRPGFPDYGQENAALRAAAQKLSGLRDRDVLLATHDQLMADTALDPARFAPVREMLAAGRALPQVTAQSAETLSEIRATLLALRKRAARWTLSGKSRDQLVSGMAKTLGRAERAMAMAQDNPTPDALHDWRKRVKYHWYHCRLLREIRPDVLIPRARRCDQLGEELGNHHDLAVYLDTLGTLALPPEALPLGPELRALVLARQADLEQRAFAHGQHLFEVPPDQTRKIWNDWLKTWRKPS